MGLARMVRVTVREPTDVATARRQVAGLVAEQGYDATAAGRVGIVVTELAQNLLRHAGGGELIAGLDEHVPSGIQVIALDTGPGMRDVSACLRDGYSTTGTGGTGLGAVTRLSDHVMIRSHPGGGTVVVARMTPRANMHTSRRHASDGRNTAVLCVPKAGEVVCGDAGAVAQDASGRVTAMLADGLGHGPLAAAASAQAVRTFQARPLRETAEMLAALHAALRATRGAALAAASVDVQAGYVTYGGIGNISAFITDSAGTRRMVSHSGTAGHTAGRIQTFQYPLHARPVLVMFSDGLTSSWSPDSHAGLFDEDPAVIAAVLYRDHARGRDDASVLVWKG